MQYQTKKLLASSLFAVLGFGMLWAVGQSQPEQQNDASSATTTVEIPTTQRVDSSRLKTLFLLEEASLTPQTPQSASNKVRLIIDNQGSLNTYATNEFLREDSKAELSSNKNALGSMV